MSWIGARHEYFVVLVQGPHLESAGRDHPCLSWPRSRDFELAVEHMRSLTVAQISLKGSVKCQMSVPTMMMSFATLAIRN